MKPRYWFIYYSTYKRTISSPPPLIWTLKLLRCESDLGQSPADYRLISHRLDWIEAFVYSIKLPVYLNSKLSTLIQIIELFNWFLIWDNRI